MGQQGYKTRQQRVDELREALADLELTERDQALLEWLSGWDAETTDHLCQLVDRVRQHGGDDGASGRSAAGGLVGRRGR